MLLTIFFILHFLSLVSSLHCNGILCSNASLCCIDGECSVGKRCQPFYVVGIPILIVVVAGIVLGGLILLLCKNRQTPAQEPLRENVEANPAIAERWCVDN
eukprot:TRINITY_DN3199_c0_g5_i1.p2 TRINITY_DN3199_c0_g5~~TRINITY_DN3199_c0_g5_i1.p2  ORF type:complete len:101 (-),score=16.25 TRINITY_DN3199_c0_g5_i1:182-484(-)